MVLEPWLNPCACTAKVIGDTSSHASYKWVFWEVLFRGSQAATLRLLLWFHKELCPEVSLHEAVRLDLTLLGPAHTPRPDPTSSTHCLLCSIVHGGLNRVCISACSRWRTLPTLIEIGLIGLLGRNPEMLWHHSGYFTVWHEGLYLTPCFIWYLKCSLHASGIGSCCLWKHNKLVLKVPWHFKYIYILVLLT